MEVGIIGLGLLGSALADRLLTAGWEVHGHDLRIEASEAAASAGVIVHGNAADAASAAPLLVLSLLTSEDRRTLLWGPQLIAPALQRGTVILDTTTGAPDHTVEDHERLAAHGVTLVDVCIAGSSEAVRDHDALALVGASRQAMEAHQDLLRAVSRRQFYFDAPGQGNRAKLIFNAVIGLHRLVLAEALGLAKRSGFNLNETLDMLRAGAAASAVMEAKGHRMVNRAYSPPAARLAQHAKDVDLILALAASVDADVPLCHLHRQLLDQILDAGAGDLDNAAIFMRYDH